MRILAQAPEEPPVSVLCSGLLPLQGSIRWVCPPSVEFSLGLVVRLGPCKGSAAVTLTGSITASPSLLACSDPIDWNYSIQSGSAWLTGLT